jgi:hypothetical protein
MVDPSLFVDVYLSTVIQLIALYLLEVVFIPGRVEISSIVYIER